VGLKVSKKSAAYIHIFLTLTCTYPAKNKIVTLENSDITWTVARGEGGLVRPKIGKFAK